LPIIIAYATGYNTVVKEESAQSDIFNDPEVFTRLGLVAMETPQACELQ
jgi:hypothetical protein